MSCAVCGGLLERASTAGDRQGTVVVKCQRTKECVRAAPQYFTQREVWGATPDLAEFRAVIRQRQSAIHEGLTGMPLPSKREYRMEYRTDPAPTNDRMVQLTSADHVRRGGWMQTFTGVSFYPLDPRAADISIEDVANGLANCCRYAGQCKRFYSVAEHCVTVSHHVPKQYAREGLLHDLSEAYLGDMVRPLKHTDAMKEFRKAEAAIEACAADAFALDTSPEAHAAVKLVDDRILIDEINQLQHTPSAYLERMDTRGITALGVTIKGWSPARAKRRFLARYAELFDEPLSTLTRLWWRYG